MNNFYVYTEEYDSKYKNRVHFKKETNLLSEIYDFLYSALFSNFEYHYLGFLQFINE